MDPTTLTAFGDELQKIAGIGDLWQKVLSFLHLAPKKPEKTKTEVMVDYNFSPKAGDDRWDKFLKNVSDPGFAKGIISHPLADKKLKQHTKSMYQMAKGSTVGKIQSSRLPGRSYEIKDIATGLACTCPDWRFKGSVNPGYDCKHIGAYRVGKVKA